MALASRIKGRELVTVTGSVSGPWRISEEAAQMLIQERGAREWWVPEQFRPPDYDEWGLSTEEFLGHAPHLTTSEQRLA